MVGLTETWLDEKGWTTLEKNLAKKFRWSYVPATREHRKGRAKGGLVVAVNKELEIVRQESYGEGILESQIVYNKKNLRVVTVYCREIKEVFDVLEEKIEETGEESLIIGGDFNARTGTEGGPIRDEKDEINRRRSRDKVINKEGREMLARIEEKGWAIMNGSKGEESELWTYVGGKGASVIDYVVANERAGEDIQGVRIGDRTESDHLPIEVTIQGPTVGGREEDEEKEAVVKCDWSQEGIEFYRKEIEGWRHNETGKEALWQEIRNKINKSTKKIKVKKGRGLGKKRWFNAEWKERKRSLRKELRKWRKGKLSREEYVKEKKEYKRWCKEERKRQEKEEEKNRKN